MTAIPARVAGVGEVVAVSPGLTGPPATSTPGRWPPATWPGCSRLFKVGGAQAVAALAYGTATVPAVDKICGPGNAYVAAAKRLVFGTGRHRHDRRPERDPGPGRRRAPTPPRWRPTCSPRPSTTRARWRCW